MNVTSTIPIRQVFAFSASAMLVAVILGMAWPRLLSSLQFLPVRQAQVQLYLANAAQKVDLPALQERTQRAISYHDAYSYHSVGSLLAYLRASESNVSLFSRQHLLADSMAEARLALLGAPLQPDLWLRLAQAGAQNFVTSAELADYFRMAIWSGRVEPTHLIARLHIGFALRNQLDADGLNLLRDQVLLAWNLKQGDLRKALHEGQLSYGSIVDLMAATHPDVVREMESVFGPVTL